MDCPHCSTENLVGAKRCVSCGRPMHVAPAFGAAPAPTPAPAPAAAPATTPAASPASPAAPVVRGARDELNALPRRAAARPADTSAPAPAAAAPAAAAQEMLCCVCMQPYTAPPGRTAREAATRMCPSCRGVPDGGIASMAPPSSDAAGAAKGARTAASQRVIVHRDPPKSPAKIAALVGFLLVAGGAGVVMLRQEPDRGAGLVASAKSDRATVTFDVPESFVASLVTTVELEVVREEARTGGFRVKALDFRQKSQQQSQSAFVRTDERGAVFDVASQTRLVDQRGKADGEDARFAKIYPWSDGSSSFRIRAGLAFPPAQLDGEPVVAGRDVAPLLHLGALAAPSATLSPGASWKADLALPCAADRTGAVLPATVAADVRYAGTELRGGIRCAVFRLSGRTPPNVPEDLARELDKATGSVSGAVWIELATGLVASADVEVRSRRWRESEGVADDLTTRARIVIERQ